MFNANIYVISKERIQFFNVLFPLIQFDLRTKKAGRFKPETFEPLVYVKI